MKWYARKTPRKYTYNFPSSTVSYSRCCNPMKLPNHHKPRGLRKLTKQQLEIYPHLTRNELICTDCRKTATTKIKQLKNEPESSTKSQEAIKIDVSRTSLSVLPNTSLSNDYIPKGKNECILVIPLKFIEDSVKCLDGLKKLFHIESCTRAQKIQILKLIPKSWSATNIMNHFDTNLRMINAARENLDADIMLIQTSENGKHLFPEIKTLIENLYLRDDVSFVMPLRKNVIHVTDKNGEKQSLQKTLLLLNLKELYQSFKEEYSDLNVGFAIFSTLRPINCILAGSSGTGRASACYYHQNVKLALLDCSIATLSEKSSFQISSYKDCFDILLCKAPLDTCYLGRCNKCPKKTTLEHILKYMFEENNVSNVTFRQWILNPEITLETLLKSADEFIPYLSKKICDLLPHSFIAMQQSSFSKQIKENLKVGEFQVLVNFAENYAFTVRDAKPGIQSNSHQATMYSIVIYYKENAVVKHCNLVIISDCLTHDAITVYTFHKILIEFLKSKFSTVTKVFYFSDDAPEYYKNDKNLVNLAYHKNDFDIDSEWHFYAAAHGTGPCDKLSGTVKRATIRASLQSANNKVSTSNDLFDWLSETLKLPNIEFRFSSQHDYDVSKIFLADRFKLSAIVENFEEQHCLLPRPNHAVRVKPYSTSLNYQIVNIS